VQFKKAKLVGPSGAQRAVAIEGSEERENEVVLPAGLILTAVGWQSLQADSSLPFDEKRCVIPTTAGARVVAAGRIDSNNKTNGNHTLLAPLYAAGWIRRGPSGIIGSNIIDSREAAAAVLEDFSSSTCQPSWTNEVKKKRGYEGLLSLLKSKKYDQDVVVGWDGWLKIDQVEVEDGIKAGKPREKLVSIERMVQVANK
jgi:adrenodoxin-NADP+ reductase